MNLYTVTEERVNTLFANTVAEVYKIARIERKAMTEVGLTAEVLHVRIHHPGFGESLITVIVQVFKYQATGYQTDGNSRLTRAGIVNRKVGLDRMPIYLLG